MPGEWAVQTAVVTGIEWDLVGKCKVQCDRCGDVYRTQVWKFPRSEDRARLAEQLIEAGWLVTGDHKGHTCPRCVESRKSQ